MKKRGMISFILCCFFNHAHAWSWADLWTTHDQQAALLMKKKKFTDAKHTFDDPAWQATAAFRAQDYAHANTLFNNLHTADGYYNQGNALAHLKQYQEALDAYQKSLKLRPNDKDTLHNKAVIEKLMQKKNQKPDSQEQHAQDESAEDKPSQTQNPKDESNNGQKPQEQKPNNESAEEPPQAQKPKDAQRNEQQAQEQESKNKPAEKPPLKKPTFQDQQSQDKQTSKQLLRMIPDDPGGLLRQKFLRDHLRRTNGIDS